MSKVLNSWKYSKEGKKDIIISFYTELDIKGNTRKIYKVEKNNNTLELNDDGHMKLIDELTKQGYKVQNG